MLYFLGIFIIDGLDLGFDMLIFVIFFIFFEFLIFGWDMFLYGYEEMMKECLEVLVEGIGVFF